MPIRSDSELVAQVQGGNHGAYGELVKRYERSVLAVALDVFGNRHDAEDAAQDAFVVAFHKLPGLRGRSKYGHWLLKITRRQALRCAKRRRQPLPLDRAVEEWPPRRTVPAPQSGGPEPADAGETRGNTSLLQWSFCPTDRRSDRAPARSRH